MSRSFGSAFSETDSYSSDYITNLKLKTIMCYLDCNPNQYVTLEYAENTYIKITVAELLYQPLSEMYKYLTVIDASNTYLRIFDASNTYLSIVDASNTYLSLVDASNAYLRIVDASNTYLRIIDASNTYLSLVDASNTYLSLVDASNTYLSLVDASNTYLSIIDASNTYLSIVDASNTYLRIVDASNTYLSLVDASNTYLSLIDASNTYLSLVDASNTYLSLIDASNTYLQITDASNTYLRIVDASNTYLRIIDASNTYLQLIDASNTYLQIIDASNNYLSRIDVATSNATSTTFTNNIFVEGVNIKSNLNNDGIVISNYNSINTDSMYLGINNFFQSGNMGLRTLMLGNNSSGFTDNSLAIGSSDTSYNTTSNSGQDSLTIGYNSKGVGVGIHQNQVLIGANSTNSGLHSIILGSNSSTALTTSCVIGYGTSATIPNQIIIGTSGETIYCPGNPSGGATPNTCLVLSSNVTLNTITVAPTSGQLGCQVTATINSLSFNPKLLLPQDFATFTSLPLGVWYITGSINLTRLTDIVLDSILLKYSLSIESSTHNPDQYGFYLNYSNETNKIGFNYTNVIINNTSSKPYYLIIQKSDIGLQPYFESNISASYLIATRIA